MVVQGLTIDPGTNSPILILKDEESEKTLPIWIGPFGSHRHSQRTGVGEL